MNKYMNSSENETKRNLRKQAIRLIAKHGYSAVSMRNIADAVGIRQGGIYNHFSCKQEMLANIMSQHMENVLAGVRQALEGASSPIDRLIQFSRFHVSYHIDFPDDVFIAYMELRSLEEDNYQKIRQYRRAYEDVLHNILDEGKKQGLFRFESNFVVVRALLAMLTGVTVWYQEGGKISREEAQENYVQIALQSVGAK